MTTSSTGQRSDPNRPELRLPDINGVEVARELRNIPKTAHISVVAWTADSLARQALINVGLRDCLRLCLVRKIVNPIAGSIWLVTLYSS